MAKFYQSVSITKTFECNLEFEAPTQEMAEEMMSELSSSYDETLYETLGDMADWPSWSLELEGGAVRIKPGDKTPLTVKSTDLEEFCKTCIEDNSDEEED